MIPIIIGAIGAGRLVDKSTRGDYTNYSIIKIDQNTEKSTGGLGRLAVSQTSVKNYLLTLVWKTHWGVKW